MMSIRQAEPADLPSVYAILQAAAADLHARGYDQWPDGSPNLQPAKLGDQIERGEFWIVSEHDGQAVAVIALSSDGDPDFWSAGELADAAVYLSKAAVLPSRRGRGIGEMLFRWAVDHSARAGARVVRLDAWRTNTDLHNYYKRSGWRFHGIVDMPGRRSGALFEKPAELDPAAHSAFADVTATVA